MNFGIIRKLDLHNPLMRRAMQQRLDEMKKKQAAGQKVDRKTLRDLELLLSGK